MKAAANGNLGFLRIYMYMYYIAPNTKSYTLHRSGNLNSLFDHMATGKILHGILDLCKPHLQHTVDEAPYFRIYHQLEFCLKNALFTFF
jgi:hypothetical protein